MGKLLSGRPALVEAIKRSVGKFWCPMKGIECKEMGDNIFMFTFLQEVGR
jgi:hypothetical protein